MIDFNVPAAAARQKLRKAETALRKAEAMLDRGCGVALGAALLNRIRVTSRQVDSAREAVRAIDPNCPEGQPRDSQTGRCRSDENPAGGQQRSGGRTRPT